MADYNSAKMIALGLEDDFPAPPADDPWSVPAKSGGGFRMGNLLSDFEHAAGSDLPEQEKFNVLKKGLSFFTEYPIDQRDAEDRANALLQLLSSRQPDQLRELLSACPAAEWLSKVFLEDDSVAALIDAARAADSETKAVLLSAIAREESRMIRFKQLMRDIKEACS